MDKKTNTIEYIEKNGGEPTCNLLGLEITLGDIHNNAVYGTQERAPYIIFGMPDTLEIMMALAKAYTFIIMTPRKEVLDCVNMKYVLLVSKQTRCSYAHIHGWNCEKKNHKKMEGK